VNPGLKSGMNPSTHVARACIQCFVTGRRLLKRMLVVLMIAAGVLAVSAKVHASPIRPDLKKVLAQPPAVMPQFIPARAGWNGPEITTARSAPNPTYEALRAPGDPRALQLSLLTTMVPDFRIIALLGLMIVLLRRVYRRDPAYAEAQRPQLAPVAALETATQERAA
jgi:hypothetical protein